MSSPQLNQHGVSLRSIFKNLEKLKNEHANRIRNLSDTFDTCNEISPKTIIEEEISILRNSDKMVHSGIAEATMLIELSNYLLSIGAEKQKLKLVVKRLSQENSLLFDELKAVQKKLVESEENVAQMEVELTHLKFLKELNKFDEDLNVVNETISDEKTLDGESRGDDYCDNSNNNTTRKITFNIYSNFNQIYGSC